MNLNNIKVIAFDVFGTLVQIGQRRSPYKKMMKFLKKNGRKPTLLDSSMIMSINGDFQSIASYWGQELPSWLIKELDHDLAFELKQITLYEDTREVLQSLKKAGYYLVLCSNTAKPYGEIVSNLLPSFDVYAWSYELGTIKPNSEIFTYFIKELNCSVDEVLFIGDTKLTDIDGSQAVGMYARLINRKAGQCLRDVLLEFL